MSNVTPQQLQQLQDPLTLIEAAGHLIDARLTRVHLGSGREVWLCTLGEQHEALLSQLHLALEAVQRALSQQHAQPSQPRQSRMDQVNSRSNSPRQRTELLISVADLKHWLADHQIYPDRLYDADDARPGYLNPNHPRYAPKLALTIRAWEHTAACGKHSPKQALEHSLRAYSAEYGLVDAHGAPIRQVIEECGKVANWQPKGGAPRSQ